MQCVGRFRALLRSLLALHVQGNPSVDVALGPHAVDFFFAFCGGGGSRVPRHWMWMAAGGRQGT